MVHRITYYIIYNIYLLYVGITTIDYNVTTVRERVVGKDEKKTALTADRSQSSKLIFLKNYCGHAVESKSDLFKVQSTTFLIKFPINVIPYCYAKMKLLKTLLMKKIFFRLKINTKNTHNRTTYIFVITNCYSTYLVQCLLHYSSHNA